MRINATLKGITPIMFNRITEEVELSVAAATSSTAVARQQRTPREQAKNKLYTNDKGVPYLPGEMLFACLIDAGKWHKIGKNKVTTMKSSIVPAGLTVLSMVMPIKPPKWEVDSRPVRNPSTGGIMICNRPRFDEWTVDVEIEVDEDIFNERFIRQLFDDAGKKAGLGDYRPNRRGPFGKFVIDKWSADKTKTAA